MVEEAWHRRRWAVVMLPRFVACRENILVLRRQRSLLRLPLPDTRQAVTPHLEAATLHLTRDLRGPAMPLPRFHPTVRQFRFC